MEQEEKQKIVKGFAWKFAERISSQFVTFSLTILLARLLVPEDFGLVAMIHIFIAIANVFVSSGFSTSLIQKKDADDLDFSTMLYSSLVVTTIIYVVIYVGSPFLADFYKKPLLTDVTRVYALVLFFYSYNSVQSAWVSRHMVFKKFFLATFVGSLFSGIIGVLLAYKGLGVWAIVFQGLSNAFINTIVLRVVISWHPSLVFSWKRAKSLMSYGSKILGADLIGTFFNELQQILVGKIYSPADLALLNRGKSFPQFFTSNIDSTINAVLFPALSNHSDDVLTIKNYIRKGIKVSSYIMFFCMTLLIIIAEPLIEILLTEKWLGCVPYLQLVCLANMLGSVSTANMQAIKATGNSGVLLKLELFKKPIYLILILVAVTISVKAVAITFPIYAVYSSIVNMYPNRKTLNYQYIEQIKDLMPAALLASFMFILIYPMNCLEISCACKLVFESLCCAVFYFVFSTLFKVESFNSCVNVIKMRMRK